jgi:hypothetical protein
MFELMNPAVRAKRTKCLSALVPQCLLLLCVAASAGEVSFSTKPTAAKDGDKVKIAFTVSAPTDVEVAVVSGDKVVRHLAAGVLGGQKDPPPPLAKGLAQTLEWDGKDDLGKPAAGGPFKVRVRAGTGVKFGRFMGESPYVFGRIVAITADEAGTVYIMGHGGNRNQNYRVVRAFDGEGRYLREIMPFPADLPGEAVKDVAGWDPEAKAFRPRNLNSLIPEFYAGGSLNFVSASAKDGLILTDGGAVYKVDARGGVPGAAFAVQGLWAKDGRNPNTGGGPAFLAASSDGQCMYLTGPFSSKTQYGHPYIDKFPPGRIYRMKLGGGETMQKFVDIDVDHQNGQGGAWRKHNAYYNDGVAESPVHGVTVDAKGNVYVADRQNQRVAVFDPSGKELGAVPVKAPHQVAVHPKTGEIYVLSRYCAGYWQFLVTVSKFKDYSPGAAALAKYDFPKSGGGWPQMALVAAEGKTSVYVSGVPGNLVVLVDKGAAFEPAKNEFAPPAEALDVFNRMEVDSPRNEVYVSNGGESFCRYDGTTGQGGLLKRNGKTFLATDLAVGYDGLLYFQTGESFSGPLERYTRELEPAPYPSGTHVLSKYIYGRYGIGNCEKGIGVGPDGKVYVAWMFIGWVKYAVTAWGPDGKPINGKYSEIYRGQPDKKDPAKLAGGHHASGTSPELERAIIGPIPQCDGGVRVDLAGNIYVGMIAGPKQPTPKAFEKNDAYKHCTGSVVKFSPEGGTVKGADDMMTGGEVEGALGFYPGLSPFSHPHLGTTCCVCRVPRFDIDRYGRLAIPNATGNYVQLVDNAGNEILSFGKYGNFDSQYVNENTEAGKANGSTSSPPGALSPSKGKPTVAVPEIPLAWPNSAGLSEKHIYALDVYNRRVVRTDLTWKAEEMCEVK